MLFILFWMHVETWYMTFSSHDMVIYKMKFMRKKKNKIVKLIASHSDYLF